MNEIDYNVEYRRLKDSTFEEVLADPLSDNVREDIERIKQMIPYGEGFKRVYQILIKHQLSVINCGRLFLKTLSNTELMNKLKDEFLVKEPTVNQEYINEFITQFDIEQFKKQILAHDNDKFMNKELEKKYIYALGCISIYFEKKKLNDDEFHRIKAFQRSLMRAHGLNNPHHMEYYSEPVELTNEILVEHCIDSLSVGVPINGEIVGEFILNGMKEQIVFENKKNADRIKYIIYVVRYEIFKELEPFAQIIEDKESIGKDIRQAKRDIKEKFKEIMRRPIDDGYEENMKIMHDDEHKFLEYLESNKYVDVQEALKHKNDLFK